MLLLRTAIIRGIFLILNWNIHKLVRWLVIFPNCFFFFRYTFFTSRKCFTYGFIDNLSALHFVDVITTAVRDTLKVIILKTLVSGSSISSCLSGSDMWLVFHVLGKSNNANLRRF